MVGLFYLAHKLVDSYPDKAVGSIHLRGGIITNHVTLQIAWFAVGCYYYLTKSNETARRYFRSAVD